jgi:hypothetical protein
MFAILVVAVRRTGLPAGEPVFSTQVTASGRKHRALSARALVRLGALDDPPGRW